MMAVAAFTEAPNRHRTRETLPFVLTERTWAISDTHWLHTKLAEVYEAEARQALGRDHNRVMIERWRETVGPEDLVIHGGDLALGKPDEFARIADQLTGRRYMIRGNHDRRSRRWYAEHGFQLAPEFWFELDGWRIRFSHRPDTEHEFVCYPQTLNVHGHIHSRVLEDRRLINISVEAIDFRPVLLFDLVRARIAELRS